MQSEFAAFRRVPLTVTLGNSRFSVPYHPAAEWLGAMEHLDVLAARLSDAADRDAMSQAVWEQPGAADALRDESLRILAEQGGRKWWEVGRLMSTSASPEVLGHLVLAGVDPWQRSVGEWCAAVFALCMRDKDEKGRMTFEFSLSLPPPGYEDEWDDGVDDLDAMEAAMSGIRGVSSGVTGGS